MTATPSPEPESTEALYARLMRERYGDPRQLDGELTAHVPDLGREERGRPRVNVSPAPPVLPHGPGRYADDHRRIHRWIARSHPEWHPVLSTLGRNGGVAHVLTSAGQSIGYSLCGKKGLVYDAPDTLPVCRVCTA